MDLENSGTVRRLEDGWDFRPDWRAVLVDSLLKAHPNGSAAEASRGEVDPFVRQYARFLRGGRCLEQKAFAFAHRMHAGRASNSGSAILKAMTVAGFSVQEIAGRLGTASKNVAVYQRLYFDVTRYLCNRTWLASVTISATPVNHHDPFALRERTLLAAAFYRGKAGLEQVLTHSVPTSQSEIEKMTAAIRGALTQKAYEFAMASLQSGQSPDDLSRYLELMRLPAAADTSKERQKFQDFGAAFRAALFRKPEEEAAKKTLKEQALNAQESGPLSVESVPEKFSRS